MNIAKTIANYLLVIPYVVLGLDFFFNFIPKPPMEGDSGAFLGLLASSGFMAVVKALEVICGVMMAVNFKKPLAYILIAPISVCILLFEVCFMKQPGIGIALVAINAFLIWANREKYISIVA
jgi:putative oxidoreductase